MKPPTNKPALTSANRRELLKLLPLVTLGAFAIPKFQGPLLKTGLAFSDWISDKFFRPHHLAPNFDDAALTPLEKFYVNTFDVDDPEIDLDHWSLTVSGQVQKPGTYTLEGIGACPSLDRTLATYASRDGT